MSLTASQHLKDFSDEISYINQKSVKHCITCQYFKELRNSMKQSFPNGNACHSHVRVQVHSNCQIDQVNFT